MLSFFALVFLSNASLGSAQIGTSVNGILNSDTVWTTSGSPYVLTGPLAVHSGTTLRIEHGAIVDIGNYYFQINGTLIVRGTNSDLVQFRGGQIVFTSISNGWNNGAGTGNLIENANLSTTTITSSTSIKMDQDITTEVGIQAFGVIGQSVISNNVMTRGVNAVNAIITNNVITGQVTGGVTLSGNVINGDIFGGQLVSNNTIFGALEIDMGSTVSDNIVTGDINLRSPYPWNLGESEFATFTYLTTMITGNVVTGGILISGSASSPIISNNKIGGEITFNEIGLPDRTHLDGETLVKAGKVLWGSPIIESNTVGGIVVQGNSITISGNTIAAGKLECQVYDVAEFNGGFISGGTFIVSDNSVSNGPGVNITGLADGSFEKNLVFNNQIGLYIEGVNATIQSNTFANNSVGFQTPATGHLTFANNNLENNSQNVRLTGPTNLKATNNWWGTTSLQVINESIYDFKNDFNLGTVNFQPILTIPNTEAPTLPSASTPVPSIPSLSLSPSLSMSPSPSVPEFQPLTAMIAVLFGSFLLGVFFKKKGNCCSSRKKKVTPLMQFSEKFLFLWNRLGLRLSRRRARAQTQLAQLTASGRQYGSFSKLFHRWFCR
jgi:hypothetical protein